MPSSSQELHHLSFPGESVEYRTARNALLSGGMIAEDFNGDGGTVKLSALFAPGKDTLAIYSFIYGPERERSSPHRQGNSAATAKSHDLRSPPRSTVGWWILVVCNNPNQIMSSGRR